ncbi:LOW QUALITY PROTEIN: membrane-spanning 4-domains subfamily A member 14 [Lemur catta]|uniref:LOW QUALITY PROTEIN: membrane-spanning 4-domains subfamily A member 14 n=1 Tax=Lemur catta TaxID=9447 RepID=UPI001E267D2E|nr:LOW QUALITY PROTEIN: membrane-spanning 4-domains subfamily A member 14 [Lemur catta]
MESPSQDKKAARVVTIQPKETIFTALPYRPHSSLLEFLRGEPKVLGVLQIMLGLIIIGFGMIFVFNFLIFSQGFPLVFLTGYPFWGALIFILTGYLTGIDEKSTKILGQGVMSMNVISSLVAVAGITLTIVTYRHQYNYCQRPSLEGICVFGTTLFVVVFFLPSDIPQDSEQPGPEQNAQLQFELQEGPFIDDTTMNLQPVFFGGYAFFKLRITRNSLASQPRSQSCNKSIYHTASSSVPDEQEQSIPPPSEEELLLPVLERRPSEHIMHIQEDLTFEQLKGEDLQPAIVKPSKMQTQLAQDQDLPLQVLPSHSVLKLQELSPEDLPAQALPVQDLLVQNKLSKSPSSHSIKSFDLTTEDLPTQYIPSQDTSSQDTPFLDALSQNTPFQDMPSQDKLSQALSKAMLSEASTPNTEQFSDMKYLLQQSPNLHPQNIQPQNPELLQIPYEDLRSEVMEETTKWDSKEELHRKKSSGRRHSLDQQTKGYHAPRRYSLDQQTRSWQSPKQKALDKQIRFLLSQQKQSPDKLNQYRQTPEQLPDQQHADVYQATRKQTPKEQFIAGQKKDHQAEKEQSPKKQTQDQQVNDQQAQEEKSLKGQSQNFQVKGQQAQVKKAPSQLYQDQESQIQQQEDWQPPKRNFQNVQPKTGNLLAHSNLRNGELKVRETKIGKHKNGNLKCNIL